MKAYRRNSIYRSKFIRRLRYGRGFGIHSPLAFQMVRSIIRPLSTYYAEDEIEMTCNEKILFRLIARHSPASLCHISSYPLNSNILERAKSDLMITSDIHLCDDHTLLYTDQIELAIRLIGQTKSTIFMRNIRKDSATETAFRTFIDKINEGLVIDLFHSAIFVYLPDVVYLYRSTY